MSYFVGYDEIAASFDRRYERTDYHDVAQAVTRFVVEKPERTVLELGCGTGQWTGQLTKAGVCCDGLDPLSG